MRTVNVNLYKFSELSEEAKEKAINQYRERYYDSDHWFINEANESFKTFAAIFCINWNTIDYEEPYRNRYSINIEQQILDLSGQRLAKYIWNNHKNDIFKGKYYGKLVNTFKNGVKIPINKDHPAGLRHVKRYSRVFISTSCVLTGVGYDDDLLSPIYEFLNNPKDNVNFETLLNDCVYSLCGAVSDEIEYQNSDDAIIETIEANEYEFTENGEMY